MLILCFFCISVVKVMCVLFSDKVGLINVGRLLSWMLLLVVLRSIGNVWVVCWVGGGMVYW